MKNKKNHFKDNTNLKNIIFYIFAVVIFFVPLIVKLKVFSVPDYVTKYYPAEKTFDFFTYYKAMLLITGTTVIFPLVVYYRHKIGNKIKFDLVAKLHMAFGVSILLSALLSSYKQVAFFGFFNKNEGAFTWWAYLLLSYSIYLFVESKDEIIKFVKVIVASTTTISIIGLFQFIGFDYIKFDWIQRLIYGPYYAQIKQSGVTMMFSDKTVYSTVANPNYIGSVMVLAIPLILYLFMESKNRQEKLIAGGLAFLHLFILVASKSTAGLLAVGVTMVIYGLYHMIQHKSYKLMTACFLGIVSVLGLLAFSGALDEQMMKIKEQTSFNQVSVNPFKNMRFEGTKLLVTDDSGDGIAVNHNSQLLWVEDDEGKIIGRIADEKGWLYTGEKWLVNYQSSTNTVAVYYHDTVNEKYYSRKMHIIPEGYTIFGDKLVNEKLEVKKVSFIKNESFLSGRGYIWNRTIPIIADRALYGYGADTFILLFPQNDIKDKEISNQLTDKPHNIYMQIGINFGILGLFLYLCILASVLKEKKNILIKLTLLACIIVGISNDNTVFTGVLLFTLIGLSESKCAEDQYE